MTKKLGGLGRGLDALFPSDFGVDSISQPSPAAIKSGVGELDISLLDPRPDQPRTLFDDEKIEQLSSSIREHGVLQPLVVVESAGGRYSIVAGERRYRASVLAGLKTVPAITRSVTELQQLEIALVENIQREDLTAIDQAVSIRRLHEDFSQSYETIARRLGKAETTVINLSRLLQLPSTLQKALQDGEISEGHARSLLALGREPEAQTQLYSSIVAGQWSVRKAELFVQSHKNSAGAAEKVVAKMLTETPATKTLEKKYGLPIRIARTAKGGKLTIAFKSDADLENLLNLL
jgi:ParB family transcriptional regulator, chromosome partitioning protein